MILSEPLLEPVARYLRFNKGFQCFKTLKFSKIVDLGCGPGIPFYHFLQKKGIVINKYIGIDPLLSDKTIKLFKDNSSIQIIKTGLVKRIPIPSSSVDYVISFATLEHFNDPKGILNDAIRILKNGGKIILTTPTFRAKPLLEFLEKIGLLSSREIHEHKHYFDKNSLRKIIIPKNVRVLHHYFEMGLNNLLVIEKLKTT